MRCIASRIQTQRDQCATVQFITYEYTNDRVYRVGIIIDLDR